MSVLKKDVFIRVYTVQSPQLKWLLWWCFEW